MRIQKDELYKLMSNKLHKAGLSIEHSDIVAEVLLHADLTGIHSHGAMRIEYYAERISKGGTNTKPNFEINQTGPCSMIFDGDNAAGHVVAKLGMKEAIRLAKENGVGVVGMRRMGHSGALSYFVEQACAEELVAISVCQSDPMAVPYGGVEPFFGTNPIAFGAPSEDGRNIVVDLAVTVQAWGKILHARSKKLPIEPEWAVDSSGKSTTDPHKVAGLNHIAGPKGYALATMIDILSGVLLGLPFGKDVTSMYKDLTEMRNLGQMHIVLDPARFTDKKSFLQNINMLMAMINNVKPSDDVEMVLYPGQIAENCKKDYEENGIEIVDDIIKYLRSEIIHNNAYDSKGAFAK